MSGDIPSDVRAVLAQLLEEGETAIDSGDITVARDAVDTIERVSRNKLPDGELRDQLLHGCVRVRVTLDEDEHTIAVAYLRAMASRLDGYGAD